jgi:sugar-specific transcriptional regulator TrmB
LKEDYEYAKENISRKLKDNVEILKSCILALKTNKNDEIYKNLENIKKATAVVVQCSKIVDDSENSLEIAQSIETEFIQYLNGEIMAMRSIEIKLNMINDETFRKIRLYYAKIESYAKMGMIGEQVGSAVTELREELNGKLKAPFLEFLQREIPLLEEKKHYKYLPYSI